MKKTGISIITDERARQIVDEGWTPEHDDQHTEGELADAASCYAAASTVKTLSYEEGDSLAIIHRNHRWPWEREWWKPTPGDRIKELGKAGALCAAEIDRLLRLEEK